MFVQTIDFTSVLHGMMGPSAPQPVVRLAAAIARVAELTQLYQRVQEGDDLVAGLLDELQITVETSDRDLGLVPRTGPAIVVANHPFGLLDSAALVNTLRSVRKDLRVLANELLTQIPELASLVIPVDVLGRGRSNAVGLRKAIAHVVNGGLLIVFPAGEVSRLQLSKGKIADSDWSPTIPRLVRLIAETGAEAQIVPAHVAGANSTLFHAAGLLQARIRTALLGRELLNKRGRTVRIRFGSPIAPARLNEFDNNRDRAAYLRWRTYLLGNRNEFKPQTNRPLRSPRGRVVEIAPASDAMEMQKEIAALPSERLLESSGDLRVYYARAGEIPAVLHEIGRLREVAFRSAGEGTGNARDLDPFDEYYTHLFVWNNAECEIAGAYRLARTGVVRRMVGPQGLYTSTLFRYGTEFLDEIGPAIELGRSFVAVEYQRQFAPLLLLWKGIGQYVVRNPECKVLFGAVSVSNDYQPLSRSLIVSFLKQNALRGALGRLISERAPFRLKTAFEFQPRDAGELSEIISDLEPAQNGIPVLLRQYLKLGGKLLGFNVDRKFSNTLDGLILVDLTKTDRKLLTRYLGKSGAAEFLHHHRRCYDTFESNTDHELGSARHRGSDSSTDALLQVQRG